MKRVLCVFTIVLGLNAISIFAAGQKQKSPNKLWTEISENSIRNDGRERLIVPDYYRVFALDKAALKDILNRAPFEFTDEARNVNLLLSLPLPNGVLARFRIEESPVMEEGLAKKFPEIKTYRGQGIDDPTASVRFDLMPTGFHAMILSPRGTVLIDPYAKNDTENYITYFKQDATRTEDFACHFDGEKEFESIYKSDSAYTLPDTSNVISGTTLRTYRLALAATGEYTAAVGGGTVAGALAAQVLIMNRVNGVYERDLAIRMVIIANNNLIIYTNAATDPYTNNNGTTMLGQNTTNLNAVIGSANYDIGHVFSTGGGGVATLNAPCSSNKARGVTGLTNPVGDAFAIDYVAHEMGHQFGANHTFNGIVGSCGGGNRSSGSAYEPGSGITIMAYAGICGNQDLARNSIDTFHVRSLEAITAFSTNAATGGSCSVNTATGNTPPTVSAVGGTIFNIPKQTPFALTATASDANNDSITYDWQEYVNGGATGTSTIPNSDADSTARPILRPYLPTTSATRLFPSLQYILNNANVPPATFDCGRTTACLTGELLPSIGRTMAFQVVARDNRASGGGINSATVNVVIDPNSGPFSITSQNALAPSLVWIGGSNQLVTWNVANTTASPINAANVKISLSTDGGQTFPTVLLASTPNDGSEFVTVPNISASQARLKIEATNNIFFDISDINFSISVVTAANASISGKVVSADGRGINRAQVFLTNSAGETRTATTNQFGFYRFSELLSGETYILSAKSKSYRFGTSTIFLNESLENYEITALP
ncbi:MAG: M12 family metallo-peptidase [Pyrinomonadaceae bacterium]|nr:M12 family metallo-peptidase [Pyrinomonadaceae bacterium]